MEKKKRKFTKSREDIIDFVDDGIMCPDCGVYIKKSKGCCPLCGLVYDIDKGEWRKEKTPEEENNIIEEEKEELEVDDGFPFDE